MFSRSVFLCVVLCTSNLRAVSAQDSNDEELWNWMIMQTRETAFEQLQVPRSIYILLDIARSCDQLKRNELAGEFLQRAVAIAKKDELRRYNARLF